MFTDHMLITKTSTVNLFHSCFSTSDGLSTELKFLSWLTLLLFGQVNIVISRGRS